MTPRPEPIRTLATCRCTRTARVGSEAEAPARRARAPAPVKDASGYYHFKPSCYGYLNIAGLSGGISNVQAGPIVTAKHFLTPTLPVASTAGTLLVATVRSDATATKFAGPAGWVEAG